MADIPQKQIFLSYAWANKDVADTIDSDFQKVGITFQRDVRDIKYTESIKDFMHKVSKSDFVVMLISEEYIKSENCMYEVMELLNSHEFEKKILPVIVGNADIFTREGRANYLDYWGDKLQAAAELVTKHTHSETIEDKKKVENIYNQLSNFFKRITDLKSECFENLRGNNYGPMLRKMQINEEDIVERALEIWHMEDAEEQEIAVESLLLKHPLSRTVQIVQASVALDQKNTKRQNTITSK